jgi:cation-transporting ATPase E
MTGDGVNDALALKDADIGVAMGSGAPATRAVAQLVLLDGKFSTLPGVVAEGRRVIANIERVANLFVTKTVWVTFLALAIAALGWPFPFLPRHLTVISTLTIGIPGFFLSFPPNNRRYVPGFVSRVLAFTIPAGFLVALATFLSYLIARKADLSLTEQRTTATVCVLVVSFWVFGILARPFRPWKFLMMAMMAAAAIGTLAIPPVADFYALEVPPADVLTKTLLVAALACAALEVSWRMRLGSVESADAGAASTTGGT